MVARQAVGPLLYASFSLHAGTMQLCVSLAAHAGIHLAGMLPAGILHERWARHRV